MTTSFPYPYFLDEKTGKIFRHPITSEDGEIFEKREFKKSFSEKKYFDNKRLKSQIEEFLKLNPEYSKSIYVSDKTSFERVKEFVSGKKHSRNLRKCSIFSLSEFDDELIMNLIKKCDENDIEYILINLIPYDLKNYGVNLLRHCIELSNKKIFKFILEVEQEIDLSPIINISIEKCSFNLVCHYIKNLIAINLLRKYNLNELTLIMKKYGYNNIIDCRGNFLVKKNTHPDLYDFFVDFFVNKFHGLNCIDEAVKFNFTSEHLVKAIKVKNISYVKFLLNSGIVLNIDKNLIEERVGFENIFHCAFQFGDYKIIKTIIAKFIKDSSIDSLNNIFSKNHVYYGSKSSCECIMLKYQDFENIMKLITRIKFRKEEIIKLYYTPGVFCADVRTVSKLTSAQLKLIYDFFKTI